MSEMEVTEGQLLSQDFGVGGPPATAEVPLPPVDSGKTPDILAAEIRTIKNQTGRMVLNASIEVGRRLTEAKAKLPHGSWGEYLKNEVDYSPSQAQNLMRVFREYGSDQQSLFGGEAKSQTFGRLTFSQALSLLVIPDEDEREKFVRENDVEHMSVRELNEALKARDEAEEKAAAAEETARGLQQEAERLREELADQAQVYKAKLTAADVETTEANRKAREAQEALDKQREKAQRLQDALSEANTSAQAAEEEHTRLAQELEELRSRPAEADTAAVEAARQAAIAEMTEKVDKAKDAKKKAEEKRKAAEESLEAAQKELADLKAKGPEVRELTQEEKDALTAEAVNKAKAEGAEQIRNLEKKLAAADPNVAEFKVRVDSWQKGYLEMMKAIDRIAQDDVKQAARNLVKAALEQMGGGVA
jgi:predicted  nucleic acid-binding Zn-ribbon protein